jgi:hypothetical protein
MSVAAVTTAIALVSRRGYLSAYVPTKGAYDAPFELVPINSPWAAVFRQLTPDGTPTSVPLGLIESRTRLPINLTFSGWALARMGLVLTGVSQFHATVRPAPIDLA